MLLTVVRLVVPVGPSPVTTALVTFRIVTDTPGADTMLMTSMPCAMSWFVMPMPRQHVGAFSMYALLSALRQIAGVAHVYRPCQAVLVTQDNMHRCSLSKTTRTSQMPCPLVVEALQILSRCLFSV